LHILSRAGDFLGILLDHFTGMLDGRGIFYEVLIACLHIGVHLLDLSAAAAAKKSDEEKQYPHDDLLFAILFVCYLSARGNL